MAFYEFEFQWYIYQLLQACADNNFEVFDSIEI